MDEIRNREVVDKRKDPPENYYGSPYVIERDGHYYFELDDVSKTSSVEVSEAFYHAFRAEFKD